MSIKAILNKLSYLIVSRKFWAALIGLGMIVVKTYKPDFPIDEAQLTNMVYILIAYILGVAIDDASKTALLGVVKK